MTIRVIGVCSLLLSFLASVPVLGQDWNDLLQVVTVSVRPGTNMRFEEFARAVREAARRQDYEYYWLASQSVSGEPVYTFNVQRGGWAGGIVDPPAQLLVAAYGEEEAARLEGLARDSVVNVHTAFYEPQADLSAPPPESLPVPDAVVYSYLTLNLGMVQQYVETSRKTREASLAVVPERYYIVQMPSFGATAVRVVGIIQSWSDLDTGVPTPGQRAIQHFGQEEGGRLASMAGEAISNIRTVLNRTRPDLNYQPGD